MASNPVSEGRAPASTSSAFWSIDLPCEQDEEDFQPTTATRVRLNGKLCGIQDPSEGNLLVKTQILNKANSFQATIFTDVTSGRFSTDYIPLNTGENPMHIEFTYRGGKVVTHDIVLERHASR